jgi:hypothetical protein
LRSAAIPDDRRNRYGFIGRDARILHFREIRLSMPREFSSEVPKQNSPVMPAWTPG